MKPAVYIESSIIGYLASKPSRDLITAAKQQYTAEWWETKRSNYQLFVSDTVIAEISLGDSVLSAERLNKIQGISVLFSDARAETLAMRLLKANYLPRQAVTDAIHIATAVVQEMDYLLTWNCKHIANAITRPKIEKFLTSAGYSCPVICTPEELEGG